MPTRIINYIIKNSSKLKNNFKIKLHTYCIRLFILDEPGLNFENDIGNSYANLSLGLINEILKNKTDCSLKFGFLKNKANNRNYVHVF